MLKFTQSISLLSMGLSLLKKCLNLFLSMKIDRIESISCEKNVDPFYDSKGIRLDVLVKDSYDETLNDEMREFLYLVNKGKAQGDTDTLAKKIEKLVEDLKKKKEGRPKYMTAYEEIQMESRRKYNEGREEGREEGEFLNCIKLVEGGYITKEIAAESLGISVDEFNLKMQNSIK